jgi:MFS family permease
MIGPVAGGLLAGAYDWHAIFWFSAAFSGVFIIIVAIALPEVS